MATTHYVGTGTGDFSTIALALAAAAEGDTIIVQGAEYTATDEVVVINKSLTIAAEGDVTIDTVTIGAHGNSSSDNAGGAPIVAKISGFNIVARTANDGERTIGVFQNTIKLKSLTVENCKIDLTQATGESSGIKASYAWQAGADETESISITGCTITGNGAENCTKNGIYIGVKDKLTSMNITGNTVSGTFRDAIGVDMGFSTDLNGVDYTLNISGNTISDSQRDGIQFGGINNSNAVINASNNTISNVNNAKCGADDGGIAFHIQAVKAGTVTMSGNKINGAQAGISFANMDLTSATVDVSNNNIQVTQKNSGEDNVAAVGISGYTPADGSNNTVAIIEPATSMVVDDSFTAADGEVVTVDGKNYTMGVNAFKSIKDAVKAASTTSETTITVLEGEYADDICFRTKKVATDTFADTEVVGQKADITIQAAAGADVRVTGQWLLGERQSNTFNTDLWDAALNVIDVTFDNSKLAEEGNTNGSLFTPNIKELNLTGCTFTGNGWAVNSRGSSPSKLNFTDCTIESSMGANGILSFTGCTFQDCKDAEGNIVNSGSVNIATSNSTVFDDCTFNVTVTQDEVDGFYVIRNANGTGPIVIKNSKVTLNSADGIVLGEGDEAPAFIVQRGGNSQKESWKMEDVEINMSGFDGWKLNYRKTGSDILSIYGLTSTQNEVADLLADTTGRINAMVTTADGTRFCTYEDGVLLNSYGAETIYVNSAYTGAYGTQVAEGKFIGFNAFAGFEAALDAAADGATIKVYGTGPANMFIGKTDSDIDVNVEFVDGGVTNVWNENFRIDSGSTASIIDGSTVKYPSAPVRGTLNIGSADGETGTFTGKGFNVYGEEGAETASINVYKDSKLIANDTSANVSYVGHGSNAARKGELNIYGGSVSAKLLKINSAGTVNIKMDAEDLSDGVDNVYIDASQITGSGKIIVDATNFAGGVDKIIDSDKLGTAVVEFKEGTAADGVEIKISDDGDVFISKVDMATIYVNAAYTGAYGTQVAEGKFIGFNAFADFESAIDAASADSSVTRIEIETDITQDAIATSGTRYFSQKFTIGAAEGKNVTVKIPSNQLSIYAFENNASIAIGEGVTLEGIDIVADGFATSSNNMQIDGTLKATSLKVWTSNEAINVSKTGKVVLGYGDGVLDLAYGNGAFNVTGSLTGTDDLTGIDPQVDAGYVQVRGNGNTMNLTDTYFDGGSWFDLTGSNFTANVKNSVLQVPGGDGAGFLSVTGSGNAFNLTEGGKLIIPKITLGAGNSINLNGGAVEASTFTNAGTINVSGKSTIGGDIVNNGVINVSGETSTEFNASEGTGIIYMKGASLDKDSVVKGGKIRFSSGDNVIDGANVQGSYFQLGAGGYNAVDDNVDTANGVTVTAKNDAVIGGGGATYAGWLGTGFYDTDDEKAAAMTDAKYTLNVENSQATFGYLHVSNDGILNVTGHTSEANKHSHDNSVVDFYAGEFIVNGKAEFSGTDAWVKYTKISCDNGTGEPGKLVISNKTNYEASIHNGSNTGTALRIYKNGILEVNDATMEIDNAALIDTADGQFNIIGGDVTAKGTFTNNGTISVEGNSKLNIASYTGNKGSSFQIKDGTSLTGSTVKGSGTVTFAGTTNFYGDNVITGVGIGGSDFELVVNTDASLLITRYVLAYGRNITVNGLITDATAYKDLAEVEADKVKLSLKADSTSGFSVSGDGTSVLSVKDAYVELGSSSWKTATGTYTWNFTNSYVHAASFGNCNAQGSTSGKWEATFDDSRLDANYIKSGVGMTQKFVNGSIGTVNSMRIDGVLDIDSTSKLTVNAYQNNKKGAQDEHGDISGTVNVAGELDLNATGNLGVELYGGKLNIDGGKVDLDKNDLILDAASTFDVKGGGTFNTAGKISNAGTITVTANSLITADTIDNNGTITVDAADVEGTFVRVIDLNSAMTGTSVNLINGSGYQLITKDNDIYLANVTDLFVDKDYTKETEGYGYNRFSNYVAAYNYAVSNGLKTTIVVEDTNSVSGNCFDNNHKNYSNISVVVKDGAVTGNALSKWDMTYKVTLEAGALLQSARPATAGYGNSHIKNVLTIGEAGAEKKAVVDFLSSGYQKMSIAVLYNGKIVANNAEIKVGDFGFTGTASFADTTITVDGIVAFGKGFYSQTMTNSEMVVLGHNLMNENKYYSTTGNILNSLTMTNSDIVIDDNADATAAEKVTIKKLTMKEGSSVTVESGTAVSVEGALSMDNSDITAGDIVFTKNGKVTMDLESTIAFNSIDLTAGGSITVDTADYTDWTYKLLDYIGDGAMSEDDYKTILGVTAEDNSKWHDKYLVFNNDLYITDQTAGTAYVDSAWKDLKVGDVTSDGRLVGFNAFGSLDYNVGDDFNALVIAGGTYSSKVGDYSNAVTVIRGGVTDITATGKVTIDLGNLVFYSDAADEISIKGEFETTDFIRYTGTWGVDWTELKNGHIRFVGGSDTVFNIDGKFTSAENIQFIGGSANISADSVMTVGSEHWGQFLVSGADVVNKGKMVLDLPVNNGSAMNILGGGSLTLSGAAASLDINMAGGGATNKDINVTSGDLVVEDGAKLTTTGKVTVGAAGSLEVNGGNVDVELLANNGELVISGTGNTIDAELEGTGKVVLDSVTLTDSVNIASTNGGNILEVNGSSTLDGAKLSVGKSGNIYVGWGTEKAATLTLDNASELKFGGAVYVGSENEDRTELSKLNVTNGASIAYGEGAYDGSIYLRKDGELNVTGGGNATFSYANFKGAVNVDGEGSKLTTNGSVVDGITLKLTNGATAVMGTSADRVTKAINGTVIDVTTGATYEGTNLELLSKLEISGLTSSDAERTIVVAFIPEGATEGFSRSVKVPAGATAVDAYFNDIADGKYSVIISDGASVVSTTATIASGKVKIDGGTIDIDQVTLYQGSFDVYGESTVNVGKVNGTAIYGHDATLVDSTIGGTYRIYGTANKITGTSKINGITGVGWGNSYAKEQVALTITGDFYGANVIVGSDHQLNVGVAGADRTKAEFANLGGFGDITVNNADVEYGYTYIRNDFSVTNATFKATDVNTYLSGNANAVIDNSTWDASYGTVGMGHGIALGCYGKGDTYYVGNASVLLQNNSVMKSVDLYLNNLNTEAYTVSLSATTGSTIEVTGTAELCAGTSMTLNGATFSAADVKSAGAISVTDSDFSGNLTVANGGSFDVTGASSLNIGKLSGTINVTDAALNESAISKGSVYFKGENTYEGTFNADVVLVGDFSKKAYSANLDFGTGSSVKIGSQMIIGYDGAQGEASSVTFGDAEGSATANTFVSADVSVRENGTLTIANTTGDNRINTMNVMGKVILDNAKLNGEVQIGNSIGDAEMIVRNGAELTLGGSSNNIVIIGKSKSGKLSVDGAAVTFKLSGSGSSYTDIPDGTAMVGYGTGAGEVVLNNAQFNALYNIAVNSASSITATASNIDVDGTLTNAGTVAVNGGSFTGAVSNSGTFTVTDAAFSGDVSNSGTFTVEGSSKVTSVFTGNLSFADGVVLSSDSAVTVTGDIAAAGDLEFTVGTVSATGKLDVEGLLDIKGITLPVADAVTTVYTGSVEYGSLVLAGSNVVDNAIVVDGKKYDVDFTNGISLKLSAAPDVEPITVTIDSLTQTAESYSFVFDLDIKGGNGDYDCEVTAKDAFGNAIAGSGSFVDGTYTFTFDAAATGSPATFTVNAWDSFGKQTMGTASSIIEVVDYTAPVISEVKDTVDGNKLSLSWSASDNFKVAGYKVLINGAEYVVLGGDITGYEFTADKSGKYTYAITAFDESGNFVTTNDVEVELYVAMKGSDVTLTQIADSYRFAFVTDVTDGDGAYTYSVSKLTDSTGKAVAYTMSGNEIILSDDTVKDIVVEMTVTDGTGETINVSGNSDVIDYTAPELAVVGKPAEWVQSATLSATAGDNFGSADIEYSLDGKSWTAGESVTVNTNGTVYFKATDAAGNVTTESVLVDKIDVVAPTLVISGNAADWTNSAVLLNLTTVDAASGIAKIEYSLDNQTWNAVVDNKLSVSANGTVYFKVTDVAGNVTTDSVVVDKIDTVAPELEISGNAAQWVKSVTLNAAASDSASDIAKVEYSLDGKSWIVGESVTVNTNGTVYFKATDKVGNVTTDSVVVDKIDNAAPTVSTSVNTTAAKVSSVLVSATAADAASGVAAIKYSLNGTDWMDYTESVRMVDNGNIYFQSIDALGNKSEVAIVTVDNIGDLNSDILHNGFSQIVGYDANRGAVGYIAYEGAAGAQWQGVWEWSGDEIAKWNVVAVGRFGSGSVDNDGLLLYNTTNNTFAAWTDLGKGDYGYESLCWVESNFSTKCIANLDGDGIDDVLIVNGEGNFGAVLNAKEYKDIWHEEGKSGIELVGAGYFGKADGNDSLLVKNTAANTYELWHNDGDIATTWAWSGEKIADLDSDWEIAAIGDFKADGIDDIVVWQKSTGYMYAWEDGKAESKRWVGALEHGDWEVAAVGDYNSDGKEDLLLRELVSGWGGLGYWGGANADNWNDLNARIESDNNGSKFGVIA